MFAIVPCTLQIGPTPGPPGPYPPGLTGPHPAGALPVLTEEGPTPGPPGPYPPGLTGPHPAGALPVLTEEAGIDPRTGDGGFALSPPAPAPCPPLPPGPPPGPCSPGCSPRYPKKPSPERALQAGPLSGPSPGKKLSPTSFHSIPSYEVRKLPDSLGVIPEAITQQFPPQELDVQITADPSKCLLQYPGPGYTFLDNQEVATLNSGYKIPLVGLGTWKAEKGGAVAEAVKTALRAGYRHIDCAEAYKNENEGVVQRESVFVTSKLWNTSHGTSNVMPACQKTLEDLQLSYLDLYLIHWAVTGNTGDVVTPSYKETLSTGLLPETLEVHWAVTSNSGDVLTPSYKETWQAMEALVDAGLVRSIGVSNLSIVKLKELLTNFSCVKVKELLIYARIKPAANQIEGHPFFRNDELIQFCKEQGIHVTAYSPLGSPDSASVISRNAYVVSHKYSPSLVKLPIVTKIAEEAQRDSGRVLIRWAVQRGTSVLPKSVNPGRIKSNLQVFDWSLDAEDMAVLSGIEVQLRMVDGSFWVNPAGW
eukprot:gene11261-18887_t